MKRRIFWAAVCGGAALCLIVFAAGRNALTARASLADYTGALTGFECVQAARQDGRRLELDGGRGEQLKECLEQLSFSGASEYPERREYEAPGFEAVVWLRGETGDSYILTFVACGPESAHIRLTAPDGTSRNIVGDFRDSYKAAADFVNALPDPDF